MVEKAAVIGTGVMGRNHARVLSELGCLSAIVDMNENTGKSLARRYGVSYYPTYQELLKENPPEAVVISTPTSTHASIATAMMDENIPILVEKPLCKNIEDAKNIYMRAKKEGHIVAVGHIERFNPVVEFCKSSIKKKKFGELYTMSATRVSPYPFRIGDVGVIHDLSIHDIDVMRHITESEVESVMAVSKNFRTPSFEDCTYIIMNFRNGTKGMLETSWLTPIKVRQLILTFEDTYLTADYIEQCAEYATAKFLEPLPEVRFDIPMEFRRSKVQLRKQEPLMLELRDFLRAVDSKSTPSCSAFDGYENLRIAEAAILSSKEKRVVSLKDEIM